jgi:hypothetical protein
VAFAKKCLNMKWLLCCCIIITNFCSVTSAQQLTGIWSGKISRYNQSRSAVENIEIQLYQEGKNLWGYSFAFKDTSHFVLYKINGKRDKKQKTAVMKEVGVPVYLLPDSFLPCEKFYELNYYKIGKTQYLSGIWGGQGVDTSCFPGEELLVVLQKIKKPDYPLELFVQQKFINYVFQKNKVANIAAPPEIKEEILLPQPENITENSSPVDRKLDIQEIIKIKDTSVTITLYDNGTVDDDTVSIFTNKKPLVLRQRISDKAITFKITVTEPGKPFEILMQAENLGSIPPNTAIMIIEAGGKRYEARLRSSFENHAVIILTLYPE